MPSTQGVKLVEVIRCPYDNLHVMPKQSFLRHLDKCKSKNKGEFKQCPFNIFHVMKKQLYEQHVKSNFCFYLIDCTSKNDLDELCDDEWSQGDQRVMEVEDWGVEESWGVGNDQYQQQQYNQHQQQIIKQTPPQATKKHERNILTESIVRPIMTRNIDNDQDQDQIHLAQKLRNLIINFEQDKQSQTYWLGENGNNKTKSHKLKKQQKQQKQQQISQVREKQIGLVDSSVNNNKSRVFAQSCIVNGYFDDNNKNKMLEMSFYQGMNPVNNNNGLQNNNQSFIIDYSISQVHNYNHPYPPQYFHPSQYPHGYHHPQYVYPGVYVHPHMQYPYLPMGPGQFPVHYQCPYDKKEEQKKMKKTKNREQRSKEKVKKQKKDKKKSKKFEY